MIKNIPQTFEDVIKLAEQSQVMWPIKPVDSISSFNTIAANLGYPINEKYEVFLDVSVGKSILKMMKDLMLQGFCFQQAHDITMKKIGK